MSDRQTTGPAYDPHRPRVLNRAQADRSFYTALGSLVIGGIEATLNARVTGWECPECGTYTYGYPESCGKCGKRRGTK